jgi:hypothetical protein
MAFRKVLSFIISLSALSAVAQAPSAPAPAPASQSATAAIDGGTPAYVVPETPEQRRDRLGTVDDPGLDPDPDKIWWRFGKAFKIERHEKKHAKFSDDPRIVRPVGNLNFYAEVYQQNEKYVWVWIEEVILNEDIPVPGQAEPVQAKPKYPELNAEAIKFYETFREDFKPLDVPKADVRVKFEESSEGLPTAGSWRNSLAVADINEDGHVDLIMPPQRAGISAPAIVLGDGTGKWKPFKFTWPRPINYGSVVAADFNKDKHVDLAFGVHLSGVSIFAGNGKGEFREITDGVPSAFPTRRIIATDVDRDGWTDVVAISEGPIGRGSQVNEAGGNLRAYLNRKQGEAWEMISISQPKQSIGGDWLAAGNFNGDRYPDFIGASIYYGGVSTLHVSKDRNTYEVVRGNGNLVPFYSFYYALTTGRFSSRDRDDAIVSYYRRWPKNVNPAIVAKPPLDTVIGLDRISFAGGEPKRTPIIRWTDSPAVWGMGSGDFDGDKKSDVIYTRFNPREAVLLLGDGAGNFRRAAVEGINLAGLRNYDLSVADVNADGRPDIILMYESESSTAMAAKNGKVQVFLNRGTSREAAKPAP